MYKFESDRTDKVEGMKTYYRLKTGRIVSKGDKVEVTLTKRMIDFFTKIGAMEEIKNSPENTMNEKDVNNILVNLERILFGDGFHGRGLF